MNSHARRLNKKVCRTDLLSHVILTRSQCHTAAVEGAKLSTINSRSTALGGLLVIQTNKCWKASTSLRFSGVGLQNATKLPAASNQLLRVSLRSEAPSQ